MREVKLQNMCFTLPLMHTHTWPRVHKSVICVNKCDVPDLQTALFYSLVHVRSEECPESFHLWNGVENKRDRESNTLHVSELSISFSKVRLSCEKLLPTE